MPTATAATTRDHDRWVVLTIHLRLGVLVVDYEDETGRAQGQVAVVPLVARTRPDPFSAAPDPAGEDFPLPFGLAAIAELVPSLLRGSTLEALLREGFADMTFTRQHAAPAPTAALDVPWLLPVYVKPPRGLEALPWDAWVEQALAPDVGSRVVGMRWQPVRAFQPALPLPWVLLDRRAPDTPTLTTLRTQRWMTPEVARFGLHLYGESRKPPQPPHITVEDGDAPETARAPWLKERRLRIRLLNRPQPAVEAGAARIAAEPMLTLCRERPGALQADPVVHLVYALAHDFALHEVLWILRESQNTWQISLASDPAANHCLRLSRTMLALRDDLASGRVAAFSLGPRLAKNQREAAHHLSMRFDHESDALTEMAELQALAAGAAAAPRAAVAGDASLSRHVEFTLQRYDAFGVARELRRSELAQPLRCGWRYRLAVQIGSNDPQYTLFDQPPPAVDTLLPPLAPGEAHELEVCVYGKDFLVLGANTHLLRLAQVGASNLVCFELRAPAGAGPAQLRVVLYHRNNLLQSFLVSAEVAQGEQPASASNATSVRAELTNSGVADFGHWNAPPRRALSVALNDDSIPGQHTLMVKVDGAAIESRLDDKAIGRIVEDFGRQAELIGRDAGREASVRQLARIGARLYELLLRSQRLQAELENLRTTREVATVQFIRHGSRTTLPWQLVYDLRLPDDDFAQAPICWGKAPRRGQPGAQQLGCWHRPGEAVICVEGFWSFRHRIERLSENLLGQGAQERALKVHAPLPHPLVALGNSMTDDWAGQLEASLRGRFDQRLHVFGPTDAPIAASLWRDNRRPALLVLFSHFHEADNDNNLSERVYACLPPKGEHEISPPRLARMLKPPQTRWRAPTRPVVLLMACQSARRKMLELSTLTDTLLDVGAAAVVGTECDVRTRDAQAFALHVARAMLRHGLTLGDAMRLHHRHTLRRRDVLSFVFTAYGHADLHLA